MIGTLRALKPVDLMTAMANEHRMAVLRLLVEGEISVSDLALKIGLSQSALSQHLSKLRALDLVETRRDAQVVYYYCRRRAVRMLLDCLDDIALLPNEPAPDATGWVMK